jgi:hypothetical protein
MQFLNSLNLLNLFNVVTSASAGDCNKTTKICINQDFIEENALVEIFYPLSYIPLDLSLKPLKLQLFKYQFQQLHCFSNIEPVKTLILNPIKFNSDLGKVELIIQDLGISLQEQSKFQMLLTNDGGQFCISGLNVRGSLAEFINICMIYTNIVAKDELKDREDAVTGELVAEWRLSDKILFAALILVLIAILIALALIVKRRFNRKQNISNDLARVNVEDTLFPPESSHFSIKEEHRGLKKLIKSFSMQNYKDDFKSAFHRGFYSTNAPTPSNKQHPHLFSPNSASTHNISSLNDSSKESMIKRCKSNQSDPGPSDNQYQNTSILAFDVYNSSIPNERQNVDAHQFSVSNMEISSLRPMHASIYSISDINNDEL